jgi:hypothetical protein
MSSQKVLSAILLFGICFLVLILNRPPFLYTPDSGKLRVFGIDDGSGNKSVFSIGFVTILIAITCFILLTIIDVLLPY